MTYNSSIPERKKLHPHHPTTQKKSNLLLMGANYSNKKSTPQKIEVKKHE